MDVSKAAWGFAERSVSPASDLIAATHAGGLTAAAFAGRKMLGFVHGFPRTNLAEPCQYSHLLAVLPEAQGRGLAVKLKHFQRDWCLARGVRLVTWMYDPFLVKNATLNLVRLGATADAFHPNLYGFIGGIYADLPSDRFEAYLAPRGAARRPRGGGGDPDAARRHGRPRRAESARAPGRPTRPPAVSGGRPAPLPDGPRDGPEGAAPFRRARRAASSRAGTPSRTSSPSRTGRRRTSSTAGPAHNSGSQRRLRHEEEPLPRPRPRRVPALFRRRARARRLPGDGRGQARRRTTRSRS